MPVPAEELKLEIVNAATGKTLGVKAAPDANDALVVRDVPDGGPSPEQWQLIPVQAAQGEQAQDGQPYMIRSTVSGKVFDNPAAADRGVRQADAAVGKKSQQWHVVPIEGEAGLYFIESATDGAVLGLADPGKDPGKEDTQVVLREHDDSAESQRWRFAPAEPERISDPVLRWAPLSHWNGRQSWRLTRSTALRPVPGATPPFSDMLLVLERFGSDQDAGGWKSDQANRSCNGQPGRWAGLGDRFLTETTEAGRKDIVGLKPTMGAVTSAGRGDGTFDDDERVLQQGAPSPTPADLWTLVDTTGDGRPDVVALSADGVRVSRQGKDGTFTPAGGELVLNAFGHSQQAGGWLAEQHPRFLADTTGDRRLDIVGCHDDGVWVSLQDEEGKFAPVGDGPVLKAFGRGEEAGGWLADQHPRFLADTTGDRRLDIVGCHDDGVWVSLQGEDGAFADPLYVLDDFGADQGWSSVEEHPRFLVATTGGGALDIVGFGPQGVVVSRGRGDGTFEPAKLVLNDFGHAQGWTGEKHLRLLADVTGDGNPDIVGFGDEGVWVAHSRGDGRFEQAQLVCRGFGYNEDAGGWRIGRHPRFLTDITGDGRADIIGFGGPGVYVARNLFRHFRTR